MNRLVVLDTNILVSAGINAKAAPAKIVEMVLKGDLVMITCPEIVDEYMDVLSRIKFKDYGFPPLWLKGLLQLSHQTSENPPASAIHFSDPSDAVFYELAKKFGAVLITGNLKDFPADKKNLIRVMSPADFIAQA